MSRRRVPREPPQCVGARVPGYCGHPSDRCLNPRRPLAEVAEELRDYPARWRAAVYQHVTAPVDPLELEERERRQVGHAIDEDLAALALELTGKLCRWCAEEQALRFLSLRKLVFVGLLGSFRASGRDERAEEEFELNRRCTA